MTKANSHRSRRLSPGLTFAAAACATVGLAGAALFPTPQLAQAAAVQQSREGEVTATGGRSFEGNITETADEIVVNRNGIVTRIPRGEVVRIDYGTPEERLRTRLEQLPANDYDGRIEVGEEAAQRRLFDLAEEVAEDVLGAAPDNAQAIRLRDRVARQRQLERERGPAPEADAGQPDGQDAQPAAGRQGGPLWPREGDLLNADQINRIRQVELQEADTRGRPPRIRFENRVIQRFVDTQPDLNFRDFNRAPDVTKALYILENSDDPEIINDVRVVTDPGSMLDFKRRVYTAVLEGCATSECHGGQNAGRFVLYPEPRTDEVIYTNFYTMTRTTGVFDDPAGAAFGGGQVVRRLIDRNDPDSSLLLQYMLPPDLVTFGHPAVEGFRPPYQAPANQQFQGIRDWITNSLERPQVDYGIDFTPPGNPEAPLPQTQPAEGNTDQQESDAAPPAQP